MSVLVPNRFGGLFLDFNASIPLTNLNQPSLNANVPSWYDRGYNHMTGSAVNTSYPTFNYDNGNPTILMGGESSYQLSSTPDGSNTGFTFIFALNVITSNDVNYLFNSDDLASQTMIFTSDGGFVTSGGSATGSSLTGPQIISYVMNCNIGTELGSVYRNGTLIAQEEYLPTEFSTSVLGGDVLNTGEFYGNVNIYRFLAYKYPMDEYLGARQQIEKYLSMTLKIPLD